MPSDRPNGIPLAVATPYVEGYDDEYEQEPHIRWEWNYCPDCGKRGAHHYVTVNGEPREGIRCG